jgi:ribosomal protein S18 acetylase RimI-like enzyme
MIISIRQATEPDIRDVRALCARWAAAGITHGLITPKSDYFARQLGPFFLVAEGEDVMVGFAMGTEHTSDGLAVIPEGERYLEIDDGYVAPEHQGSGAGTRLIQELENQAKSAGIQRFLVYSASKDIDGILRFYRGCGYKAWFVQMFK